MGVLCLIALLLYLMQLAIDHLKNNNWWLAKFGGTAGNLVSSIIFFGVMIKLNEHTFDVNSFCLMNNKESICQYNWPLLGYSPDDIDCSAIYNSASNDTSNVMVHYDGYSGFIKINYSSETDFKK